MKVILSYSILLILFLPGCNNHDTKNSDSSKNSQFPDTSMNLKIHEDSLQNITANGDPVSLATLESRLKELKAKDGLVIYDCRNKLNCPPSHSLVIDLINKYGFSINLLVDNQFQYIPRK